MMLMKQRNQGDGGNSQPHPLHKSVWLRLRSAIPAIVIMIVIFLFSCQNATQSGAESTSITEKVLKLLQHAPSQIQTWARTADFKWVEFLIRKFAHVTEYAILGAAICFHFVIQTKEKQKWNWKSQWICSVIVGACYAGTDEFHQLFVPGRSGQIRDVGIDTIGVIIGAGIFLLLACRKIKKSKKR